MMLSYHFGNTKEQGIEISIYRSNKWLYVSLSFRIKNKKRFNDEITRVERKIEMNVEFYDNFDDDSVVSRLWKRKNIEFDSFDYTSLFSSVSAKWKRFDDSKYTDKM